jgi:uncharacterized protein YndB with AHSA1/START domain
MSREFETVTDVTVIATPEQVWEAIATGPGVDSWFMGRNEIEPAVGGKTSMTMPGLEEMGGTVTAWEPPSRFAMVSDTAPDGSFHAFEYLVEGRAGGSSVVRVVHHGILSAEGWEMEFDALRKGDPLYFNTIATYLEHFGGRVGVPVSAWAPPQQDEAAVWSGWLRSLGLSGSVAAGDPVTITLPGREPESGVVDSVLEPGFLGVRTDSGLYRFVGRLGGAGLGHHVFTGEDSESLTAAWTAWLEQTFPA